MSNLILLFIIIGIFIIYSVVIIKRIKKKYNKVVLSFKDSFTKSAMPIVTLKYKNKDHNFLVDSGSIYSFIDSADVDAEDISKIKESIDVYGFAGSSLNFTKTANMTLAKDESTFYNKAIIGDFKSQFKDLSDATEKPISGILGGLFLRMYNAVLDYKNLQLKIPLKNGKS